MGRRASRRRASAAALAAGLAAVAVTVAPASSPAGSDPKCPNRNDVPTKATIAEAQEAVMCLVNQERAKRGKRPLKASDTLTEAAAKHSRDMVARRYFDHNSPGGRDMVDRVMAAHWTSRNSAWRLGENIAWGTGEYATPRKIVAMWMASPGHRDNILGPFREAGAGVAAGAPQRTRRPAGTYTMDFGTRG
jgi:uncharacterized protein YkwD